MQSAHLPDEVAVVGRPRRLALFFLLLLLVPPRIPVDAPQHELFIPARAMGRREAN